MYLITFRYYEKLFTKNDFCSTIKHLLYTNYEVKKNISLKEKELGNDYLTGFVVHKLLKYVFTNCEMSDAYKYTI